MARRLPSTPPVLSGFTFVRVLGSGGFADVFLYEQQLPRRNVAIKVLLPEVVNPRVRDMFQSEAQLMSQLSTHPAILSVFEAGVSSDGRPYLVTEVCNSGYGERFRAETLPVAEALRTGIKIAAALETAHRANVLHRDIKPGNILITAYGHPVLSDFGIASSVYQGDNTTAVGLSVPWSAPEVIRETTTGTTASEIWALGATVYSLLAGRSPFEVPGKDNSPGHLAGRILKSKPQPIGRDDVPPQLEALLLKALSKNPIDRQHSAVEFARELQQVETSMGLAQTPLDVVGDEWGSNAIVINDNDRTMLAPLDAHASPSWRRAGYSGTPAQRDELALVASKRRRRLLWSVLGSAAALIAVITTVVIVVAQ
ncbi:serine/threonine-protein kinase [Aurantimicrobium minutum]|uniref:non-specific serine/threonine protein kinase n=1 Tax=Aurantimicrobium minutum TaxID=708131 RepID=A0A173LVB7_9MICO|nr:serine/threonine-protein kinase [Aurantimicrobium minutum]BAU98778.1 serine/threonine-protein kinase [Aurantimicrobium minutum]